MATLHTGLPKPGGERALASRLSKFEDPKLHLWFGLDYLPGVRDVDCLMWHEDVGVFVVEVKAIDLNMIQRFGFDACVIRDRSGTETPQRQAYSAGMALRRFLDPLMRREGVPWVNSTACWPVISRHRWQARWNDAYIADELASSMLFDDDFQGTPQELVKRLQHIKKHPPFRGPSSYPFRHSPSQFESFCKAVARTAEPKPVPSDLKRLQSLEEKIRTEIRKQAPADAVSKVFYSGYPGAGKTFRLLQIGLFHAQAGRRVLFACYNKVLASDVRRLLCHSKRVREAEGGVEVVDVFDLLRTYAVEHGLDSIEPVDYDGWGELITSEMKNNFENVVKYDTVLIDESQDMKQWMLEMLGLHATEQTTVCVAGGRGQELYGETCEWLEAFRKSAAAHPLNRNFRNKRAVFQMAFVFHGAFPKPEKIEAEVRRVTGKHRTPQEGVPEFDRDQGERPAIRYCDESELESIGGDDPFFSDRQRECRIKAYKSEIERNLNHLAADGKPLDLLVLVPNTRGLERGYATAALDSLATDRKGEVSYIDYTIDENRRDIAQPEMIRLCTFHSARGLEGYRVVIFGFERIEGLAESVGGAAANLGYIALSRSLFECEIIARSPPLPDSQRKVIDFLREIRSKLPEK